MVKYRLMAFRANAVKLQTFPANSALEEAVGTNLTAELSRI